MSNDQVLIFNKIINFMDVKEEDTSEESMRNHITYYKSLSKIILDIQKEATHDVDPTKKDYLDARMDAIEKDRKRIREMFPNITEEEWNDNTN